MVEIRYRPAPQEEEWFAQTLRALPLESWWEDWMRHADRYLALVRAALEKDPDDLELLELLHAMEAAVAAKKRPLH